MIASRGNVFETENLQLNALSAPLFFFSFFFSVNFDSSFSFSFFLFWGVQLFMQNFKVDKLHQNEESYPKNIYM
jgi:hypothetical protein